jgi:ribosomal protein S18 acetylase RimI-like enzyme
MPANISISSRAANIFNFRMNSKKNESDCLKYVMENEFFFMQVLDKFSNSYKKIPPDINFYPFYKKNQIDSLIVYSGNGIFYPLVKEEYSDESSLFIKKFSSDIFSIYGMKDVINKIYMNLNISCRNHIDYFVMKLDKDRFMPYTENNKGYSCIKCDDNHFQSLKELQYLYHLEEVYDNDDYYPYEAEMKAFKNQLGKRLNYALFDKKHPGLAVSKSYINAESPNCSQIGGNYTLKKYRNKGLSKLCLSFLIEDVFTNEKKNHILLFVKKNNIPAINVYKKLGFEIIFETGLYYF